MSDERKYLFVGGPLDGTVRMHDGGPLIVEPSTFTFEPLDGEDWRSSDDVTLRVSASVAFYVERKVEFSGGYLHVMATQTPTQTAVASAVVKALGLTLWAK